MAGFDDIKQKLSAAVQFITSFAELVPFIKILPIDKLVPSLDQVLGHMKPLVTWAASQEGAILRSLVEERAQIIKDLEKRGLSEDAAVKLVVSVSDSLLGKIGKPSMSKGK